MPATLEENEVQVLAPGRKTDDRPMNNPVAGICGRFCPACGGQCQVSAQIYPHTCMCPKGHHWR